MKNIRRLSKDYHAGNLTAKQVVETILRDNPFDIQRRKIAKGR